jgi:hypothetical protein
MGCEEIAGQGDPAEEEGILLKNLNLFFIFLGGSRDSESDMLPESSVPFLILAQID